MTKIENTCTACDQVISSYEYQYNEQGYIIEEKAVELEAGTRKAPAYVDWYHWGNQTIIGDTSNCHHEKEVETNRTYEYDDNWELTRCTEKVTDGAVIVHNYTYDKAGNRTEYERVENGVQKVRYKYEYNEANQLVRKKNCKIWGDAGVRYEYDADGNLIKTRENNYDEPIQYEYTAENRLAVVKQGSNVLMAVMYDGDNNRVFQIDNTYKWEDCYGDEVLIPKSQRTENGDSPKETLAGVVKNGVNAKGYSLTEYINDVNRENTEALMEYHADDTVRQAYTYGKERLSVDKSDETSYYLYNGQSSVTGLITDSDKLAHSYRYDPYGNLTSGTPDAASYYGYNAESMNVKTGLQYLRARYYRPETGTFTTEDSYLGTIANPLTRNRYAYVGNNPLNYSDPTGHRASAMTGASAVTSARLATKLINAAKAVTSPSAAAKPINALKNSNTYRNAKKNQTNAQKAKNASSKIKSLTQRLREAHVKAFCTLDRAKVKTDWKKIGKIVVDGMFFPFKLNMSLLGAGLGKLGEFVSSPIVRGIASSIVEAAGALMLINGIASAPAAATAGATGIGIPVAAVDGALIAAGTALLFVGDVGRRQAADDLAEEWSHNKENKGASDLEKTKGEDIKFGSDVKSEQKLNNQMKKRGWTEQSIRDTVDSPYTTRHSTNKATGNSATVYYTEGGSYVIVDDITKEIVQISDNINPSTWVPDSSIVNPYIP